jgi:hypothetical protein
MGGKTFGVVKIVCRRRVRMPVRPSAFSSWLIFSALRWRSVALTIRRRAALSGT